MKIVNVVGRTGGRGLERKQGVLVQDPSQAALRCGLGAGSLRGAALRTGPDRWVGHD